VQNLPDPVRENIERFLEIDLESIEEFVEQESPEAEPGTGAGSETEPQSEADDDQSSLESTSDQSAAEADEPASNEGASSETREEPDEAGGSDAPPRQTASERIGSWLRDNLGSIFQFTVRTTGDAVSVLGAIVGSLIYAAFLIFLVPFYFFFFSTAWPNIRRFVRDVLPPDRFKAEYELLGKMDASVSGFVRGRIVISLIMGVLLSIGWWICGVPYWMLVGMTTGVLCAVPYLGGVGIPAAILLLWLGQAEVAADDRLAWWGIIFWPTLVFTFVQLLEAYLLTPLIAGKATNLGPVSIIVAVLAGGVVMGVYGMLLAIPVMACLKIMFMDVFLPRVHRWARGQAEDILPIEERSTR